MRSFFLLGTFLPLILACDNPDNDACASVFTASSAAAASFCKTYTTAAVTQTTALPAYASLCSYKSSKLSSACSCLVTAGTTLKTSTTDVSIPLLNTSFPLTDAQKTTSASTTGTSKTTTAKSTTATATTTAAGGGTTCICTEYSQITSAVASCTNIVLDNISAPASSTILLTKLKSGSTVTFAGKTVSDPRDQWSNVFNWLILFH
jgi:polygalacturonase